MGRGLKGAGVFCCVGLGRKKREGEGRDEKKREMDVLYVYMCVECVWGVYVQSVSVSYVSVASSRSHHRRGGGSGLNLQTKGRDKEEIAVCVFCVRLCVVCVYANVLCVCGGATTSDGGGGDDDGRRTERERD